MDVMGKVANKRLIDANRALEIVRDQGIAYPSAYHLTNYATLILQEAPTVDAVEVVRCRDCKHKRWVQEPCHGRSVDFCRVWNSCIYNLDGFCNYGERKDSDGND